MPAPAGPAARPLEWYTTLSFGHVFLLVAKFPLFLESFICNGLRPRGGSLPGEASAMGVRPCSLAWPRPAQRTAHPSVSGHRPALPHLPCGPPVWPQDTWSRATSVPTCFPWKHSAVFVLCIGVAGSREEGSWLLPSLSFTLQVRRQGLSSLSDSISSLLSLNYFLTYQSLLSLQI